MFADTGIIQKVEHISVDVRQVFEGHQSPEPGGAGSFVKLDEDLLFRERGGPKFHFVLLQDLVDEAALDHRKKQFFYHQHREEHCPCPHDMWERTAFLSSVLSQPLEDLIEC